MKERPKEDVLVDVLKIATRTEFLEGSFIEEGNQNKIALIENHKKWGQIELIPCTMDLKIIYMPRNSEIDETYMRIVKNLGIKIESELVKTWLDRILGKRILKIFSKERLTRQYRSIVFINNSKIKKQ